MCGCMCDMCVSAYVHVCPCMLVFMYVCAYIYIYIYMHIHGHTHRDMSVFIYGCMYMCFYVYVCMYMSGRAEKRMGNGRNKHPRVHLNDGWVRHPAARANRTTNRAVWLLNCDGLSGHVFLHLKNQIK